MYCLHCAPRKQRYIISHIMARTNSPQRETNNSGGEWLYRQGELLLGPVPLASVVEKLYVGELNGNTEIQKLGSTGFRRLAEVDVFRVHWARAQAKLRVDAVAHSQFQLERKKRLIKGVVFMLLAIVGAGLAAYAAMYLAIHKPWKRTDDMAFGDILVSTPVISRAQAPVSRSDYIAYPGSRRTGTVSPPKEAAALRAQPSGSNSTREADGLEVVQFDQAAINAVVARNQNTLHGCLKAEALRQPGLAAKIPIEFAIGNDGRVKTMWIDNPSFKTGPLPECMLRELQKWKFVPYEGQTATVGITFRIGKKEP